MAADINDLGRKVGIDGRGKITKGHHKGIMRKFWTNLYQYFKNLRNKGNYEGEGADILSAGMTNVKAEVVRKWELIWEVGRNEKLVYIF